MALGVPSLQSLASGLPQEVQDKLRSALAAQDKFNQQVARDLASISAWSWIYPQLLNAWVDFSDTLRARYALLSCGLVVLAGAVRAGAIGDSALLLPVALRPDQDCNFAVENVNSYGKVVVSPSGYVTPTFGSSAFMALDGCAFLPAQVV